MRDLLFLRNSDEILLYLLHFGDSMKNINVYVPYPPHYLQLIKVGIRPNIISQYIRETDAHEIYTRAFNEISEIVNSIPNLNGSIPINLARYFKVHYWEYLTEIYAMDQSISRLLDDAEDVRIHYFAAPHILPNSHTELTNYDNIFRPILNYLGKHKAIVIKPIGTVPAYLNIRQNRLLKLIYRLARGFLMAEAIGKLRNRERTPFHIEPNQKRVIAIGSGYDAITALYDAQIVSNKTGLEVLWMTEGVDKNTLRTGLVYKDEYEEIERFSIGKLLSEKQFCKLHSKEVKLVDQYFEDIMARLNEIKIVRQYALTKLMRDLKYEYRQVLLRTKAMDFILGHFTGSTVVVIDYNGINERALEQLKERHKLKIIGRPHGFMNNIEGFEYDADEYLVWGELARALSVRFYGKNLAVYKSPDPGLKNVSFGWLKKSPSEQRDLISQKRYAHSIDSNKRVILLMTTAARYRRILNEFDYDKLKYCWDILLKYLNNHDDIHMVIKSHKFNFDNWVSSMAISRKVSNLTILEGRLEDAVIISDLVVDFGKPGTATLTALLLDRPLLLYKGLYKYVRQLASAIHILGKSSCVDTPELLIDEIEKMRRYGTIYLETIKQKNKILKEYLFS